MISSLRKVIDAAEAAEHSAAELDLAATRAMFGRFREAGPQLLEARLSRSLTQPEDRKAIADLLANHHGFQISSTGSGKLTVGMDPAHPLFTWFFSKGEQTRLEKVLLPKAENCLQLPRPIDGGPVRLLLVNLDSPRYPFVTSPTGIVTLGGYLKYRFRLDIEIQYLDSQLEPGMATLVDRITQFDPLIVGFSVQMGGHVAMFESIAALRAFFPDKICVLGNVVATYGADMIHHKADNVVTVLGPGEASMEALIQAALWNRESRDFAQVPGCSFVQHGIICETRSADPHVDYRPSLPDWEGLFERYSASQYQEIWIEASRGCPYKCTYCATSQKQWQRFPFDRVSHQLRLFNRLGRPHVRFADEEFLIGGAANSLEFARQLKDERDRLRNQGLDLPSFDFAARVDDIVREGRSEANDIRQTMLRAFRDANLRQIFLGIESGSPSQLERFDKRATPRIAEQAIAVLRHLGIGIAAGWIMIDPLMESIDELRENIAFLDRNNLIPKSHLDDFVTNPINRMRVLEGTPSAVQMANEGLLGERKPDLVEYEFQYKHKDIAFICQLLSDWEDSIAPLMYALKTKVGADVLNGEARIVRAAQHLMKLKECDFSFIKTIVRDLATIRNQGLSVLTDAHRARWDQLLKLREDIKAGLVPDSNGRLAAGLSQTGVSSCDDHNSLTCKGTQTCPK